MPNEFDYGDAVNIHYETLPNPVPGLINSDSDEDGDYHVVTKHGGRWVNPDGPVITLERCEASEAHDALRWMIT